MILRDFPPFGKWLSAVRLWPAHEPLRRSGADQIAFEADLRGVLPLPTRQAMDAFLLVFSLAQHRELGAPEIRAGLARRFLAGWIDALEHDAPAKEVGWYALRCGMRL